MAENMSDELVNEVSLTVLVDKEKSKVVYAEAGNDFVDALFSFLTLPLGTIARLMAKDSNIEAVKFGSISSLYQSVSELDEQYLWSQTFKEMLLIPRSSAEGYCQKMKLNIDDTEPLQSYFLCENKTCKIDKRYCFSYFRNQKFICGKLLNQEHSLSWSKGDGFVMETAILIVSDDLHVMPNVVGASLNLLQKNGVNDIDAIDKQTINISKEEVVDLLKFSLVSKTLLTDFIFKREQFVVNLDPRNLLEFWIKEAHNPYDEMVVKVVRRKSNEQILFVEAQEDFADFIFSFLTFPLGGVLHMLQGFSFVICTDNLYKSLTELNYNTCLRSETIKDLLTNPPIFKQFELGFEILPIHTNCEDYNVECKLYNHVDPDESDFSRGYINEQMTFMVTDDLVVTPMSSSNVVSYLERMKAPLNDLEERVVRVGVKEGLSILKASLTTTSALTNGLSLYIIERFMNEQKSQSINKE